MSERGALSALLAVSVLVASLLSAQPVRADPVVTILDLPFRARAMRGPGSEVSWLWRPRVSFRSPVPKG